ncbi:HNH endonuclease [Marinicella litoralis]|uniref:HNH endonuclease n=1 Tax=Marinicella litoralis TaxID=644220 RepID=A0A4R6XRM2_9GAMM|nr:HNH endonuclease signature motif containing protein [Marinicella litoralis]TDR20654.1 hypothetical protein C8D91_1629 [Marinicella litoralis]
MEDCDPNRPHILKNKTCVYCGLYLSRKSSSKEHVIGRKFLPKGKLENCWNLIANACSSCNNEKSILENDISAITMQPTVSGQFAVNDEILVAESLRKAENCKSQLTNKLVKYSQESLDINCTPFSGMTMNFKLTSSPQIETDRLYKLARYHIKAFYYLLTFTKKDKKGMQCAGAFMPLIEGIKTDWGNPVFIDFMNETSKWLPRLLTVTADGFFKASIKEYKTKNLWSWALEWNHKYRLVGFFGSPDPVSIICDNFAKLDRKYFKDNEGNLICMRKDTPLDEKSDSLFT